MNKLVIHLKLLTVNSLAGKKDRLKRISCESTKYCLALGGGPCCGFCAKSLNQGSGNDCGQSCLHFNGVSKKSPVFFQGLKVVLNQVPAKLKLNFFARIDCCETL